jgi:hypothetical protein
MVFNVRDFAANINRYGTLQTNRFEVVIRQPVGFPYDDNQYRWYTSTYRADQVKLPGIEMALYDSRRYGVGPLIKVATGIQSTETTISFIETGNNDTFKLFYDWTNLFVDYSSYRRNGAIERSIFTTGYKQDLVSPQIDIRIFNDTGRRNTTGEPGMEPVTTVCLVDAFPTNISDTSLSWGDNNNLYKVNVTFAFTSWFISTEQ